MVFNDTGDIIKTIRLFMTCKPVKEGAKTCWAGSEFISIWNDGIGDFSFHSSHLSALFLVFGAESITDLCRIMDGGAPTKKPVSEDEIEIEYFDLCEDEGQAGEGAPPVAIKVDEEEGFDEGW